MKHAKRVIIIAVIVIVLANIFITYVPYNSMVEMRNKVRQQKAQVENVLQARSEKIPDLVASVKSYVKHEEAVFIAVSEARSGLESAINSGDMEKMANANEQLTSTLIDLKAVVEAYPELQSSQLYLSLNDEISGSVNRIAQERRTYNKIVMEYNNFIEVFPNLICAKIFGFSSEKYFEASDDAHKTNVVDFGG